MFPFGAEQASSNLVQMYFGADAAATACRTQCRCCARAAGRRDPLPRARLESNPNSSRGRRAAHRATDPPGGAEKPRRSLLRVIDRVLDDIARPTTLGGERPNPGIGDLSQPGGEPKCGL